ncbi:hypothetical protein [Burkholderia sp. LA-2-3-30-S1-D2]|uniref:hypothetical protein n=1 Tax=Burkholderia sp. LA-2-3-30-S1-D2 TaxID=1637862 RepID=UPI000A3FD492|nr:hypothetical protein [Burkholderia sp. LA-2-3-30-S1-D2]
MLVSALVHSPFQVVVNLYGAMEEVSKAGVNAHLNAAAALLTTQEAREKICELATTLRGFIPVMKEKLHSLSRSDPATLMDMLNLLIRAMQVYEHRKHVVQATVSSSTPNQAKLKHGGGEVEVRADEAKAQKPARRGAWAARLGRRHRRLDRLRAWRGVLHSHGFRAAGHRAG